MANIAWTYDSLFAALQAWPVDSDDAYLENLPSIIGLGELRLVRDLNLDIFDTTDETQSTVIGTRTVTKPATCVVLRDVGVVLPTTGYKPLERRSKTWCEFYAPVEATTGEPEYFYEASATQIIIVPTPNAVCVVKQFMNARPTDSLALSAQGPSWLSRCVPDALFAACLMESEQLIKADDRYADYRTKYYQEILPVARLELRSIVRNGDRAPLRAGPDTQ